MSLLSRLLSRSSPAQSRSRLGVQQLEDRSVPTVLSALSVGNDAGHTAAEDVAVDAAGNTYQTGYFGGTVDFDPARALPGNADVVTARGSSDAFVAKYAPDNSLVWVRRMGGDSITERSDLGRSIAIDASGNVYVTGSFSGTADFGTITRTASDGSDAFTVKLNSAGALQWANNWDGSGYSVGLDANGNVYASGMGVENGSGVHRVLKFKPNGKTDWAKWFATGTQTETTMATDAGGNVYLGGHFTGTVGFKTTLGTTKYISQGGAGQNSFVLKLTPAGAFSWVAAFTTPAGTTTSTYNRVHELAVDGTGNVFAAGVYKGVNDFDPKIEQVEELPGNATASNVFVVKLTSSGGFAWANALNVQAGAASLGAITTDAGGNVYLAGQYNGTTDFDPGEGVTTKVTTGLYDAFVVKLSGSGDFAWAQTIGGSGNQMSRGIAVSPTGTVTFVGHHRGMTDFDPDPLGEYAITTASEEFTSLFCVNLSGD